MSTVLECNGLAAGYDGVPVVRNLDLHVRQGEVVALMGPNGAGKTTTLLALSALLKPIAGSVSVCGEPVRAGRPHLVARRGLAHVPDDRSLFYGLTAAENLRLALGRRGDGANADLVLEYFPALKPLLQRRAGLLSGGEQQMLALGRALVGRPKALMIDEMSLGLAPVIVRDLLPVIRRIAVELGTAILLVEQHVDLALAVADRAYVLNYGELALEGAAADLLGRRDLLRASYMGETVYDQIA